MAMQAEEVNRSHIRIDYFITRRRNHRGQYQKLNELDRNFVIVRGRGGIHTSLR